MALLKIADFHVGGEVRMRSKTGPWRPAKSGRDALRGGILRVGNRLKCFLAAKLGREGAAMSAGKIMMGRAKAATATCPIVESGEEKVFREKKVKGEPGR